MPYRPQRPCSVPGCPRLTNGRYCDVHQRLMNKQYELYQRNPDTKRKYGNHWQRIRKAFVEENPFCQICGRPTEEVHHRVPLAQGGSNDWSNLMALCSSCHARLHAKQEGHWKSKTRGAV